MVREHFGVTLIGVQPIGSGADARAPLFRGVGADACSHAVKPSSSHQPGIGAAQ
jgi:spectinomycin phosphotransferase